MTSEAQSSQNYQPLDDHKFDFQHKGQSRLGSGFCLNHERIERSFDLNGSVCQPSNSLTQYVIASLGSIEKISKEPIPSSRPILVDQARSLAMGEQPVMKIIASSLYPERIGVSGVLCPSDPKSGVGMTKIVFSNKGFGYFHLQELKHTGEYEFVPVH